MIINHNLTALNTFNALTKNTNSTQKSLQKLSSGLRINGAADDAAGLAISEKMKGQMGGLEQAARNSQDGISLLQTAEGGLNQTQSMLKRMRQLAVQSATDTNTASDRVKIQSEVDELAKEITRISNDTEFNTQNLLAGGLSDTFHIGANANQNISLSLAAMDAHALGVDGSITTVSKVTGVSTDGVNVSGVGRGFTAATTYNIVITDVAAAQVGSVQHTVIGASGNTAGALNISGAASYTGAIDATYLVKVASTTVTATATGESVTSVKYSTDNGVSWVTLTADFDKGYRLDGVLLQFAASTGTSATQGYSTDPNNAQDTFTYSVSAAHHTLQLQDTATATNIGAGVNVYRGSKDTTIGDSLTNQTVDVSYDYEKVKAGTETFTTAVAKSSSAVVTRGRVLTNALTVAGLSVLTQADANKAITSIDNADLQVSAVRSQLGAYQNRLTNTIDNLNTSDENITAAESRIADVDMASEVSNYQKNNVLQQAATAMLAHANQQPQTVLQLLQG